MNPLPRNRSLPLAHKQNSFKRRIFLARSMTTFSAIPSIGGSREFADLAAKELPAQKFEPGLSVFCSDRVAL